MALHDKPSDASSSTLATTSTLSVKRDNVLILGSRKAGKSSSFQVVFESLNPEDALQEGVTQTHKSEPYDVDTFHRMRIWDGTSNFNTPSKAPPNNIATTSKVRRNGENCDEKGLAAFGTAGQLYWTECSAIIFIVDSQVSIAYIYSKTKVADD